MKNLRSLVLESLYEAGRLAPLTSEAGRSALKPYDIALKSLIGLTKAAIDGGMTRAGIGHNSQETEQTLSKIMIPWVVSNYDYLQDNSTSFGESTQALTALTGPDGKKKFRPEFAAYFGKEVTPQAKAAAFKVRDVIKNNLLGGFIINGSRGFWKLHIYAIGEVLGKNPPQLKAKNPQEQEYLDQDKEAFKKQYADTIKRNMGGSPLEENLEEMNGSEKYIVGALSQVRMKLPKTFAKYGHEVMEAVVTEAVEIGYDPKWGENASEVLGVEEDFGVPRKTALRIFKICEPYNKAWENSAD